MADRRAAALAAPTTTSRRTPTRRRACTSTAKADGGWEIVGGTSEASPLIAAYYALVGAGTDPSWAYNIASTQPNIFNDPVSGSNGTCNSSIIYICNATTGYDGPTGLGTISGAVVSGAPGIAPPGFGDARRRTTSPTPRP